jgi:hypothetical protein
MSFFNNTAIALMLLLSGGQSDVTRIETGTTAYRDLTRVANEWKEAVSRKDPEQIARFTWPEYRAAAVKQLKNRGSALNRAFIDPNGEFQRLLRAKNLRLAVFEQGSGFEPSVRNYAVCFGKVPNTSKLDRAFVRLISTRRDDEFCTYWVSEREGTFISFSFGIPE